MAAAPFVYMGIQAFKLHANLQNASLIKHQGALQKKIILMNAEWAERDAWEAERYGYTLSARYKSKETLAIGQQKASYEAQGVETEGTTAQELDQETRTTAFLNTIDIQRQARADAMKFKHEVSNIRLQGNNAELQARLKGAAAQGAAVMDFVDSMASMGMGGGGGGGASGYGGGGMF